ncbi:MAG: DNA mismatch repair endonuclease MutL, partial [Silicimonas sp.]|nr:DNA mismatch repair endonuclease MutL [Silicimonas sp.]
MHAPDPKIRPDQPEIRLLDEGAINRIAAGEVVERPASAVKELIENAIDAGARQIDITVAEGGKRLIRIEDDGCGIPAEQLPLALSRHATSKIDGSDLLNIHTFGFRGEALASLAAVGRLTLTSRPKGAEASMIEASGGAVGLVRPAAGKPGTVIELRDLFYATPARLKFLRTERGEMQAVTDVVKRLAMAEPYVGFTLTDATDAPRKIFAARPERGTPEEALSGRLRTFLGANFIENAIAIDASREDLHLSGFAALPTYSRGSAVQQYLFVNGRPVRDK